MWYCIEEERNLDLQACYYSSRQESTYMWVSTGIAEEKTVVGWFLVFFWSFWMKEDTRFLEHIYGEADDNLWVFQEKRYLF